MSTQQTLLEQLTELYQREANKALEYQVRLLKITLTAERELKRIGRGDDMAQFLEEIIRLAEGKA